MAKTTQEEQIRGTPLDDKVLTALERSPYVPRKTLRFETAEGRVTLRGVVCSYFQKQMAQEALRRVEGVHEILNELEVAGSRASAFRDADYR
ncbi:MAG: BON domain-containing protein [Thermoguttaceae bacterium]|jgi:osmotically-inducible protein OsmY|nr:BON domain-containing protein [Thermoguttaceae bacterium]